MLIRSMANSTPGRLRPEAVGQQLGQPFLGHAPVLGHLAGRQVQPESPGWRPPPSRNVTSASKTARYSVMDAMLDQFRIQR
jgi:hypothetical protein